MGEFFNGWRRKFGCVSLLMACVIGTAWGRSHFVLDKVEVRGWHEGSEFKSYAGYFSCTWQDPPLQIKKMKWTSEVLSQWREIDIWIYGDSRFDWNWRGLKAGSVATGLWSNSRGESGETRTHFRVVYYWALVLPLTLLSATLILWKPRKRPEPEHA